MNDKQQLAAMGEHLAEQNLEMVPEYCAYPLHITTKQGSTFFVAVDRKSGAVHVGGDAEASDAAKTFLKELGILSLVMVPEGWQLVPVVPTEEMCEAGANAPLKVRQSEKCWIGDIYAFMLAAAPKPHQKP